MPAVSGDDGNTTGSRQSGRRPEFSYRKASYPLRVQVLPPSVNFWQDESLPMEYMTSLSGSTHTTCMSKFPVGHD